MSSDSELSAVITEPVASWLLPLDGNASGPDLEYDPAFLELAQTAAGKPETQFAPAEVPLWPAVKDQAEGVFARTRDLRVALLWGRSLLNTEGLPGLLPTLQLFNGLLDNFWDQGLHPALDPDDGDAFARANVLGSLDKLDGLLGDVRGALVMADRRLGGLRVREIEVALERLPARADETPRSLAQLQGPFNDVPDLAQAVRSNVGYCLIELKQLQRSMNDRFGIENSVDVKALRGMLEAVATLVPQAEAAPEEGDGTGDGPAPDGAGAPRGSGVSRIDSRKDAIRAIQLICEYLERSEPTNPAQLLLRRAERLIEKDFLQLVRELAPDAVAEVARIMGVDPDTISSGD